MLSWVLQCSQGCWGALIGVWVFSGVLECSQGLLGALKDVQALSEVSESQMHQHSGESEAHLKWGAAQSCPLGGAPLSQESPLSSLGPRDPSPQNKLSCSLGIQLLVGGLAAPGGSSLSACSGAKQLTLTAPDPAISHPLLGRLAHSTYHPHITGQGCLCPG